MGLRTRDITVGALLTALALLIPIAFRGWLQVYYPPFSATLGAHVPVMLSMLFGPGVAAMVGIGSTLGFLFTMPPVIAARAAVHIVWAVMGAYLIKERHWSFVGTLLVTIPVHALGEALVVIPFGFSLYNAGVVVGVGTVLHHTVDAVVSLTLARVAGLVAPSAKTPRPLSGQS